LNRLCQPYACTKFQEYEKDYSEQLGRYFDSTNVESYSEDMENFEEVQFSGLCYTEKPINDYQDYLQSINSFSMLAVKLLKPNDQGYPRHKIFAS
jgi:hypothetical protein